jgi:hypothetical protein
MRIGRSITCVCDTLFLVRHRLAWDESTQWCHVMSGEFVQGETPVGQELE